ncbi:MAG TPA: lysylphosphatidylglycerol synthase transmembrane domain-containing protein [Candidatus Saccharimonadales bacterium]|nr:lysylphosphatidylglycerol synthase transmembrane domain-containing protein [Candidatus Saccharimonadales bacterium]
MDQTGQPLSFWKQNWKLVLNILTVGALLVLIYAIRHQLVQTLENLRLVNIWWLLLMVPIQYLNYFAQTKLYLLLYRTVNEDLDFKSLFKAALELNFINHVFPSGGVSGISYFSLRMRRHGIRAGKTTLVQLMKLVLVFLSFEIMLIFGLFVLAAAGRANNLTIFIGSSISMLMVAGTLAFTYVIGSKQRINGFFTGLTRALNRVIYVVRPQHPETINIERVRIVFDELHEDYILFKSRWQELKAPFWYALLANVTEVLTIYIVYIAFGHWVNIGAVILAYAIANFAGLVSVLPGGIGIYEALMTAVLVSAGVPAALSLPVTVMYRVVNTLIQVPPGYVLYHRALRSRPADE